MLTSRVWLLYTYIQAIVTVREIIQETPVCALGRTCDSFMYGMFSYLKVLCTYTMVLKSIERVSTFTLI